MWGCAGGTKVWLSWHCGFFHCGAHAHHCMLVQTADEKEIVDLILAAKGGERYKGKAVVQ